MTQSSEFREALKSFPIKENNKMDCYGDGDSWVFAHETTIRRALKIAERVCAEPSEGMIDKGRDERIDAQQSFKRGTPWDFRDMHPERTTWNAMTAQMLKEISE